MANEQPRPCALVVDDDEASAYAMARILGEAGFEVATAANYFDALETLDRLDRPLDVLVTDVVLNLGNGFALARSARLHHPGLRTVYVTAFDIPTEEAVGPVLKKPVNDAALVATVRAALADRDERRGTA